MKNWISVILQVIISYTKTKVDYDYAIISIKLYLHNIMRSKANKKCRIHEIAFNSVTNVILQNKVMSC